MGVAKILVVDDDEEIRNVLKILLTKEKFKVVEASDGEEALELIDETFDLIILDIMMSKKDGISACIDIREKYFVPILFLVVDNINELKKNKVIDVIKYNKGKYYSVTKVEGKQYLFLLYDNENYNMIDGCLISKRADKALFKDIKVGMSKTEIKNKDSSMLEYFDYSYHHMDDKSLLEIKYKRKDGQDVISEFSYLDAPISVIDYLTKEDLEKIMK